MTQIVYDETRLTNIMSEITRIVYNIECVKNSYKSVKNSIDTDIRYRDNIGIELEKTVTNLENLEECTYDYNKSISQAMAKYTSCEREINKSLKEILDITYTSVEDTSSNRIKDKESKYYKMQSSIGHLLSIVEYDHKKDDSKQGYGSSLKRGPLVASAGKSDEFMYHSASEVPKKEGGEILKNIFENYAIDSGIYDLDPETGQIIIYYSFIPTIKLTYNDDLTHLEDGMVGTKYHIDLKSGEIYYDGVITDNRVVGNTLRKLRLSYPYENSPTDFIPSSALKSGKLISYKSRYMDGVGYTHIKQYRDEDRYMQSTEKVTRHLYEHHFENLDLKLYEIPDQPGAFSISKNDALNGRRIGIIDKKSFVEVDDGKGGNIRINAPLTTLNDIEDMDNDYTTLKKSWQWVKAGIGLASDVVFVIKGLKLVKASANAYKIIDKTGKYAGYLNYGITGVERACDLVNGDREVSLNEAGELVADILPILGTIRAIINAWEYSADYVVFDYDTGEIL